MSIHYQSIIAELQFCPIVMMIGPPGAGKTTALNMVLDVTGGADDRFITDTSRQGILKKCVVSSMPVGWDDPSKPRDVENLCIDLYNGATKVTVGSGSEQPRTTVMVTSNFAIERNHR